MDDAIKRALEVAARAMNTPYHRGECCQSVDGCTEAMGEGPCMCRAMVAAGIAAFLDAVWEETDGAHLELPKGDAVYTGSFGALAAAVWRAAGGG